MKSQKDNQLSEGGGALAWIYLIIASFGEIFGVMFINIYIQKRTITRLILLIISFGFGFLFLSMAMNDLPLGTAYAVWTGLGAAGAVLMGIIFFNESAGWKRLLFLSLIICGAIGLRILE